MLSLEMARKLKDAGLKWEPQQGDFFNWRESTYLFDKYSYQKRVLSEEKVSVWLPRLDQLLAEIEKRGYRVVSGAQHGELGKYTCTIYGHPLWNPSRAEYFTSNTREEAAAQALLWILEQEEAKA